MRIPNVASANVSAIGSGHGIYISMLSGSCTRQVHQVHLLTCPAMVPAAIPPRALAGTIHTHWGSTVPQIQAHTLAGPCQYVVTATFTPHLQLQLAPQLAEVKASSNLTHSHTSVTRPHPGPPRVTTPLSAATGVCNERPNRHTQHATMPVATGHMPLLAVTGRPCTLRHHCQTA